MKEYKKGKNITKIRKPFFDEIQTGGRPKYILNDFGLEEVTELASTGNTDEDIATVLRTSVDLLKNADNRDAFEEAKRAGLTKFRQSLRKFQFQAAMNGDSKILMFLGKNVLGQTDNPLPPERKIELDDDPITMAIKKSMGGLERECESSECTTTPGTETQDGE